ncbi:MAG: sugar phosphate isomerase/epimerase family protein [Candidatus Latescibacterota bacterium]
MKQSVSRRNVLKLGAGMAGALLGAAGSSLAWDPGPNEKLKRDLRPGKTPIRLATGMARRENEEFELMVKRVRDGGYTAVATGADPWHDMPESELVQLRAALKKFDVTVYEVGGYRNMLHTVEAERQKNLKHLARCIEAAEKIGCPMVGTISGSRDPKNLRADYFAPHPDNWTEATWKLLIQSVRQVLRDTSGCKCALGMEAQVTTNQDTPKSHRRLMDDIGDPRVKVNLDPTNMVHLYNYYHTTELINECFDLLGEDIIGAHAKDTFIIPDQQTVHVQEVCPGRGVMDYEMYLVRLSRLKWPRALLPEHIPGDQYIEAKAYIEKVAAKVGVKLYS